MMRSVGAFATEMIAWMSRSYISIPALDSDHLFVFQPPADSELWR